MILFFEEWLKDGCGRTLSHDDLGHYRKEITALRETLRFMAQIDAAIGKAGSCPVGSLRSSSFLITQPASADL